MSSRMGWAASMIGRTLDAQYRVDGILGEGAMGVVFRGVNLAMDKPVAIKMMRKDTFDTPDAVERFKREARVWSQLNHPAITQVFDFGIQDGMPFLVMELVEGADLSEVLKKETRLKPMRAVALMRQLASALEEAHRVGVVHRDIKPQNMKLLRYQAGGRILLKVLDFGMAKQVGNKAQSLTAPGILVGTPKYIAPEQVTENPKIDGRTDLYAAGVLFYELLTGQAPFLGTPHEVLFAHLGSEPKPLPETVPHVVQEIVMRLLRKKPEERYANAALLDQALEEAEEAMRASASGLYSGTSYPPVSAVSAVPSASTNSSVPVVSSTSLQPARPELSGGTRVPTPAPMPAIVPSTASTPPPRSPSAVPSMASLPPRPPMPTPSVQSHPASMAAPLPASAVRRSRGRYLWPGLFVLVMCGSAGLFYGVRHSLTLQRTLAGWLKFYKVPQDEEVERALGALQTAVQNRTWATVLVGTEELQRRYGDTLMPAQQHELSALRQEALSEQPMQDVYQRLEAAAQKRDHEEVVRLYTQLATDSVYRTMAQPAYDAASEAFVGNQLMLAAKLREQHKCAEFTAQVQKLLDTVPGHPLVRAEQRKPCTADASAPSEGVPVAEAPALLPEELTDAPPALVQANQAYGEKKYAEALAATQALLKSGLSRKSRAMTLALRLGVLSACQIPDAAAASHLFGRMDDAEQSKVLSVCEQHGFQLATGSSHRDKRSPESPDAAGDPSRGLPLPPPIPTE